LDIPKLTDRADLIVVGQVTEVSEQSAAGTAGDNGATPMDGLIASLRVKRVIKGSVEADGGQQDFLRVEMPRQGIRRVDVGTTGVFFLKQAPSHTYTVVDSDHPYISAREASPSANSGDALGRVADEVAEVLQSEDSSIHDRKDAIFSLRGVKTDTATAALRRAARGENAELRLLAMVTLLQNGDTSVLGKFAEALLNAPSEIPPPYTAENLSGALRDIDNPEAVPTLARLLHAQDAGVRANAAMGLRHIGTEATIAPLSEALDDSDQTVRYNAVMGLATAFGVKVGGVPTEDDQFTPSIELFKSDEQRFINHWKERVRSR
jgi:HEAT repeat protein